MEKKVARPYPSTQTSSRNAAQSAPNNFSQQYYPDTSRSKGKYNNRSNVNNFSKHQRGYGTSSSVQRRAKPNCEYDGYEVNNKEEGGSATVSDGVRGGNKHGLNANHLLNFQYAPVRSQETSYRRPTNRSYGWRNNKTRTMILTKEQFLQANCQFVVREGPADDYSANLADPDLMIDWSQIEQVRLFDDQIAVCPICLDVPVSARITKCAHIFCWPCILHYLSLSDRAWSKCPICVDAIEEKDLKCVASIARPQFKVGDEITLHLMKRERESLYVRPVENWRNNGCGRLFGLKDDEDDVKYSKIISASIDDLLALIYEEKRQLQSLLNQEDTQTLEASFVTAALNNLKQKFDSYKLYKPIAVAEEAAPSAPASPAKEEQQQQPSVIKTVPASKVVTYSDAFDNETVDSVDSVASSEENSAGSPSAEIVSSSPVQPDSDQSSPEPTNGRVRNESSTSSCDSGEAEQLAADLVLPPTGTQPGAASGSKRTEVYYFYQAADGQRLYLHSVNTRILAAQYGSLELSPPVLSATIVECETNTMTPDLRKRLKYLSHLPMHSQFTVCEVTLRPPVVSSAVLSHFTEELNNRKKARNRRQRAENKQYGRAMAEERRQMGRFPDMRYSLDSDRHFPRSNSYSESEAFTPVPLSVSPDVEDAATAPVPCSPTTAPPAESSQRKKDIPLTTPFSFANATRGCSDKTPAAIWPRVNSGATYVRSSGAQALSAARTAAASAKSNQDEEEVVAPTFKDSFSVDFDRLFDGLNISKGEAPEKSAHGSKKKKSRKQQQQLLFSTSGQRANM